MPLEKFLTEDRPLGPERHEAFGTDHESAAALTADVKPFKEVFSSRANIIVGRKGSGKTSIIQGYRSLASLGKYAASSATADKTNKAIRIVVAEWEPFYEMVNRVAVRMQALQSASGIEPFPETVSDFWKDELWDLIFRNLYSKTHSQTELRKKLSHIVAFIERGYLERYAAQDPVLEVLELHERCKEEARQYFESTKQECLILLDSMENYPIKHPNFALVVTGFLKCVSEFSIDDADIRVVYCIPEEHIEFFRTRSSNNLKDFSDAQMLKWRPTDLLRVVAERYRLFLKTHEYAVSEEFNDEISGFDFEDREQLQAFFSQVMEKEITNGFEFVEDALAYVIRHTQLLPREFIMIFNRAITLSKREIGSWRRITAKSLRQAVEESETKLAMHILRPYEAVYPLLLDSCRHILPQVPAIAEMSDLDAAAHKFKRRMDDDILDVWQTLYDMGVLGYIDEVAVGNKIDSDRYVYGAFKYNSPSPIAFGNNQRYCFHPLFSRLWSMQRRPGEENRCVYPAQLEHFRLTR